MEHSIPHPIPGIKRVEVDTLPPMSEDGSLSRTVCQTSTFFDFFR